MKIYKSKRSIYGSKRTKRRIRCFAYAGDEFDDFMYDASDIITDILDEYGITMTSIDVMPQKTGRLGLPIYVDCQFDRSVAYEILDALKDELDEYPVTTKAGKPAKIGIDNVGFNEQKGLIYVTLTYKAA